MGVQQDVVPSGLITEGPWESNPWFIGIQRWNKAEKAAEGIISKFQPTIVSERKRNAVINYLQRLLKDNLDCEVFAYGSVPLKTYLPDGDIDLSAVGASNELVKEIASLLSSEAKNSSAEFVVKDVQLIGAEVDRVIKKDHLFKRSIILIKAWCYFESRTLGAHVGLISTYGLETLVLYIFHVFHTTLDGPLSVLYKFLEYFSAFDWDNYGISLMGPVRLSELPRITAERPPNSDNLLLKIGFLRHCSKTLSVPVRAGDVFSKKHLNIVDPLNDRNNLGRSVSQGNFFRIRSAFGYGAKKLGQILMNPEDNLAEELHAFFSNTLNMHGSGQRPDLPDHVPRSSLTVTRVTGKPRSSNDENSYVESRFSSEGKDEDALMLSSDGEVREKPVAIPFYAPHLLFNYSKLVNKVENGDADHEDGAPNTGDPDPSEVLDLTGDLMSHVVCLEHVRWWNGYVLGQPAMMGPRPPPPPPPPGLLNMLASEHGGMNHRPRFHPSDQMFMSTPSYAPNDPIPRGPMTYFPDVNRSRHGYQTSTSNAATNNGSEGDNHDRDRRRHQNPNQRRQPERPRSVSGMDRFSVQSSYHLKDDDDFPPLSA